MLTQTGVASVKRFLERFTADPDFREQTVKEPGELAKKVRPLWDAGCTEKNDLVESYRAHLALSTERRKAAREAAAPVHPRFRAWRERQILRCWSELGKNHGQAIVHHPVAFELNKGCSVGCWFCGVSAPKLSELWDYRENRSQWRATLELFTELLGPAAGQGVLYWATDPLDNPDYELFCQDFYQITGSFPPTTTALAARYPDRARRLLEKSRVCGCARNRFSVLSLGQLKKLHTEFSPEELLEVDLVLQNRGSLVKKSKSGRAREEGEGDFTIACVSGFLLNMVEGSVALISPCKACDAHPDGYRVHAEARFQNTAELKKRLSEMTGEHHMPTRIHRNRKIRFRSDLTLTEEGLQNCHATHQVVDRELAELINREHLTAAELALRLADRRPLEQTFLHLQTLFQRGLIADEPTNS